MNGDDSLISLLDQLDDIVEPPPVAMWPATPAWLVVALLLAAVLGVALRQWLRHRRATAYRHAALAELNALLPSLRMGQPAALGPLEILLRRTAIAAFPESSAAALTGLDWLAFLDKTGGAFLPFGQILVDGPYLRQPQSYDGKALAKAAQDWIRHHHD